VRARAPAGNGEARTIATRLPAVDVAGVVDGVRVVARAGLALEADLRKVPYYTASHTNPHTTLKLNKNREVLRQRKVRVRGAEDGLEQFRPGLSCSTPF
jgi:hypothetical protein